MPRKQFDPALHAEYDLKAKHAVLRHLSNNCGMDDSYINPDKYGPDIVSVRDEKAIAYCEVEVKTGWLDSPFPFPTLHIPLRKLNLRVRDRRIVYFILNRPLTRMVIFEPMPGTILEKRVVKNRLVPDGEEFVIVPASLLKEVELAQ